MLHATSSPTFLLLFHPFTLLITPLLTHWHRKMSILYTDKCPTPYCVVTHSLTSQHYSFAQSFTVSLTSSLFHLSTQKNRTRAIVLRLTYSLISQKSLSLAFARPITFADGNGSVTSKILNDWNVRTCFTVPDHTGVLSVLRAIACTLFVTSHSQ